MAGFMHIALIRTGRRLPLPPDRRWSLGFLSDIFGVCRKFRILGGNLDRCRKDPAGIAVTGVSVASAAHELAVLDRIFGRPARIASHSGMEFTSRAFLKTTDETGAEWHCLDPGRQQKKRIDRVLRLQGRDGCDV
ncbi:MAG: hypothetical protein ACK4P8_09890 [Tabrizicola sp.]